MNTSAPFSVKSKTVLGVAAHPDDLDFFSGGTVAALAKEGAHVYYLILTDGSKGSNDRAMNPEHLRDTRRDEQRKAANLLGVKDIFFCDYPDAALENTLAVKRDIVKIIRQVKPDLVITMDPSELYAAQQGAVNHTDHRAAGQATLDAIYPLARDHMAFPELLDDGLEPHNVATVLLSRMDAGAANFIVDISDLLELKFQALSEHVSQSQGLDGLKAWAKEICTTAGTPHGYTYGEPFVRIDIR